VAKFAHDKNHVVIRLFLGSINGKHPCPAQRSHDVRPDEVCLNARSSPAPVVP
jgi:hypothetical protein